MDARLTGRWRTGLAGLATAGVLAGSFVLTSMVLTADDGAAVTFERPDLAALPEPPAVTRQEPLLQAISLAGTLSSQVGRVRAACLEQHGFPQVSQSLAARREGLAAYRRGPLESLPVEFGPSTDREAATYGFAGVGQAVDDGEHGTVVSRDPSFDAVAERCDTWIYGEVAPGLKVLQSRGAEVTEQATLDYHQALMRELGAVTTRRVDCVRAAYPAMPTWQEMRDLDEEDVLGRLGIPPGQLRPGAGEIPSPEAVAPGRVRMFPPTEADVYVPSAAEVRFAERYAACGRQVGFGTVLERGSRRAAAEVQDRWRSQAQALVAEQEAALLALRRP